MLKFADAFGLLLRRSVIGCYDKGCFGIAKAGAYSALLSFIPVLTALATVLVQVRAEQVSKMIAQFLFLAVPPGSEDLVQYSFSVRGARPKHLLVLAVLLSLWAASGVMMSLMDGFRASYRIPQGRPAVKQRLVAVGLVLLAALPFMGASTLLVMGNNVEKFVLSSLGVIPSGEQLRGWVVLAGVATRYLLALAALSASAAGLYYFGPNRPQQWRNVWPGALLATALWLASTAIFAWYVRNIANYNVMYGSIGAVIALLVWMYVLAVISLIGCEYNAQRELPRQ
ncbi:MAG: YihY/virulence factor BrkB family protein [Candidatus Solibacter usitatus]|nr:YihY/virulence factor BrkB family protein [Candidatus Solibacter usitatus]